MNREISPLSDITEQLQEFGKAKSNNSIMTGYEFIDQYGISEKSSEDEPNKTIATAGGDIHHAYTKVNSSYNIIRKNQEDKRNNNPNLIDIGVNIEVIIGNIEIAEEKLMDGVGKLESVDKAPQLCSILKEIRSDLEEHRKQINKTSTVLMN